MLVRYIVFSWPQIVHAYCIPYALVQGPLKIWTEPIFIFPFRGTTWGPKLQPRALQGWTLSKITDVGLLQQSEDRARF